MTFCVFGLGRETTQRKVVSITVGNRHVTHALALGLLETEHVQHIYAPVVQQKEHLPVKTKKRKEVE